MQKKALQIFVSVEDFGNVRMEELEKSGSSFTFQFHAMYPTEGKCHEYFKTSFLRCGWHEIVT